MNIISKLLAYFNLLIRENSHHLSVSFHFYYVYKPNFVFITKLVTNDKYLSVVRVTTTIKRHFRVASDTALHQSKDFAVSPSYLYEIIPEGILWLSP